MNTTEKILTVIGRTPLPDHVRDIALLRDSLRELGYAARDHDIEWAWTRLNYGTWAYVPRWESMNHARSLLHLLEPVGDKDRKPGQQLTSEQFEQACLHSVVGDLWDQDFNTDYTCPVSLSIAEMRHLSNLLRAQEGREAGSLVDRSGSQDDRKEEP